jgi:integrating conjugative element protein (TIGR03757 family)
MARVVGGFLSFLLALPAPQAFALESVEVFTDAALFPITSANLAIPVEIHDLSTQQKLLDELGQGLPNNNPALAKGMAASRLDRSNVRQRLADATAGAMLANRYGIAKIPAILFDRGAAVAYGLTDVNQAIQLYQRWKEIK